MTTMTRPRGPLPARVYWVRRGLVLLVALALVVGIARVLGSFGGNDAAAGTAATVAQRSGVATAPDVPGVTLTPLDGQAAPLSQPTGACDDAEVSVVPDGAALPGGGNAPLRLKVTTSGATCTWAVSPRSLVVRITSGKDRIWTSQDCPAAIPRTSVVVRPVAEKPSTVVVRWSGKRSVAGCIGGQSWARPGFYHAYAASLGGQPADVQFRLAVPPRPTVTKTAKPTKTPTASASTKKPTSASTKKPSSTPTRKPSPAKPTGSAGSQT